MWIVSYFYEKVHDFCFVPLYYNVLANYDPFLNMLQHT